MKKLEYYGGSGSPSGQMNSTFEVKYMIDGDSKVKEFDNYDEALTFYEGVNDESFLWEGSELIHGKHYPKE